MTASGEFAVELNVSSLPLFMLWHLDQFLGAANRQRLNSCCSYLEGKIYLLWEGPELMLVWC